MIKAIFFDIDGTLVSFQTHTIPESAKRALCAAHAHGVRLFIATGRHRLLLKEGNILGDLPFDGYVTLNGQYCYTRDGQMIHEQCVDPTDIAGLLARLEEKSSACLLIERDRMYANLINEHVKRAWSAVKFSIPPIGDVRQALHNHIYQINLFLPQEQEAFYMDAMPHSIATRWSPYFSDIGPRGGSKAVGIEKLAAHFSIPMSDVMAIGDGENDIDMLRAAGIGVAMGNASDAVKKVANYVTTDVDHDGILNAFKQFLPFIF
ncbi:Cof-type HAD-IIB family hydrolase [Anaerotruncus colihominis]|uniref:Cof-type HAD-IIB family hydrolase n=1 Tax=Anaerotruncus colihominis TaxID=169435 RepID=UPI0026F1FD4F|nr:Cof-type HAD-IIB family hydrolase [Anaerotruncus colihominis]